MRPSYKPIKRRESKAFALRRQTIKHKKNENDTFDEPIENIDDYWQVASQKLAISSTIEDSTTVKDHFIQNTSDDSKFMSKEKNKENTYKNTAKNKLSLHSKSFKEEYEDEIQKINVSGISDSINLVYDTGKNNDKKNEKIDYDGKVNLHNGFNNDSSNVNNEIHLNDDSNLCNDNDSNYDRNSNNDINFNVNINDNSNSNSNGLNVDDINDQKTSQESNNEFKVKVKDRLNKKTAITQRSTNQMNKTVKNGNFKANKNYIGNKKIDMNFNGSKTDNIASSFIKNQNDCLYITNVQKIERNKNQMNFLIETDSIETGIIFLNDSAFVEEIVADKSFSLLVIKGAVNVKIENELFCLKKHGMTVINKNQIYSIEGLYGYNSIVFITYSLK